MALLILIGIDALISPVFRYHRYRYSINEECIDIQEGNVFVKRHNVAIERLHKLETAKGPIDQIFKVAKVVVTTAGGDVTISFLDEKKAEQIAESLRRRINETRYTTDAFTTLRKSLEYAPFFLVYRPEVNGLTSGRFCY